MVEIYTHIIYSHIYTHTHTHIHTHTCTHTHTHTYTVGMPKSMVKVYEKLQSMLTTAVDSCGSLTKDPQNKKYRFDLQKAVSTPVNAISSQSGEHLHNIIMRLKRLLSGQPVEVTGRTLSTNLHPAAKLYCSNLLAKKIVVSRCLFYLE